MWFDDRKSAGKNLFVDARALSRRSSGRLNTRQGSGKGGDKATKVVLGLLLAVIVLVCVALVVIKLGEALYSHNDRYKIANIEIRSGKVLTPDLVREYTRIHEGMYLFGFDAAKVRADFMRRAPNVKSMTITRQLPDTLKIEIVERDPIARFGSKRGYIVADGEGFVFVSRVGNAELPIITGYSDSNLKLGDVTDGAALAALEALDGCNDPRLSLRVESIDVSLPEYMVLAVPQNDVMWQVKLAWKGMGTSSPESKKNLMAKLNLVVQTLQSPQVKGKNVMNATAEGGRVYVE